MLAKERKAGTTKNKGHAKVLAQNETALNKSKHGQKSLYRLSDSLLLETGKV